MSLEDDDARRTRSITSSLVRQTHLSPDLGIQVSGSPTPRLPTHRHSPRQQLAAHCRLHGRVVGPFQDEDPVDFFDGDVRVVGVEAEAPFAEGGPGVDFFEGVGTGV